MVLVLIKEKFFNMLDDIISGKVERIVITYKIDYQKWF